MHKFTVADKIWNRACEGGGDFPLGGDRALADLLLFHGLAMNGGVLHATECLSSDQLNQAKNGYRYFGYELISDLLVEAEEAARNSQDLDDLDVDFDARYAARIPDDETLVRSFENHLGANDQAYAPYVERLDT